MKMNFETIAKILSEEEGRYVSPNAVKFLYYRAIDKLRKRVYTDKELEVKLRSLISEEHSPEQALVYEILDSMVEYDNE